MLINYYQIKECYLLIINRMDVQNLDNEEFYRNSIEHNVELSDNFSEVTSLRNPKKAGKWSEDEVYSYYLFF